MPDGFDHDMNVLIQSYLLDYKRQRLSLEEIDSRPRYKRVWFWWRALAHFNIGNNFTRLELAPRGILWIKVTDKKTSTSYTWENNTYRKSNCFTIELCKAIYGN